MKQPYNNTEDLIKPLFPNNMTRSDGLDLFRFVSMIFITILHLVNQHYHLLGYKENMYFCGVGHILEHICFCGVNSFAILSGFLFAKKEINYDKKWLKKFITFWCKMVLWMLLSSLFIAFLFPTQKGMFNFRHLFFSFFPMFYGWWYICAYFGLLLIQPLLSFFICKCSNNLLLRFSITTFIAFSVLSSFFPNKNAFGLANGYSTLWLMICFIWGGTLYRFYHITDSPHFNAFGLIILFCSILFPIIIHFFISYFHLNGIAIVLNYLSPFCVVESILLLLFFSKIKFDSQFIKKFIKILSINSLGIYLFQCNPLTWNLLFENQNISLNISLYQLLFRIIIWIIGLSCIGILFNIFIEKLFSLLQFSKMIDFLISILSNFYLSYKDKDNKILLLSSVIFERSSPHVSSLLFWHDYSHCFGVSHIVCCQQPCGK